MSMLGSLGQRVDEQSLSQRLDALAELARIGRARQSQGKDDGSDGGFSIALLDAAESVLKRAGERLRLSSNHTVVALAGGTGSGKSTLFNALSGASFSSPGVTRPTTRHVHACVWGMQGAGPLLDWLGVQRRHRYARASVLPQEPPKICHFSMPRCARSFSMSLTRSQVVLSTSDAKGVLFPQPR